VSDSTVTFVVLGAAVVLFASGRLAPEIVAIGAALALYAAGVITADQTVAGFGDPAVVFIASLFVVGEALDSSGVTAWAGQTLIAKAGSSLRVLLVALLLLVAVLSALITPNGSVAALIPVGVVTARRIGLAPSKLLMPLAFAASAGALLALTGSPVNVIVSEASIESGHGGFGFLSSALVGIPLVLGTVAIAVLVGDRLLPERHPRTITPDLSQHARTLIDQYNLDRHGGDRDGLAARPRIGCRRGRYPAPLRARGAEFFPGMITESGDLQVLAVQRNGRDQTGQTVLAVGDTLLLEGAWSALDRNLDDRQVLVVDSPLAVRRQAVPFGPGAKRAVVVLVALVAVLATGVVPAFVASLVAACAVVVLRVVSIEQAYRAISWTTVILVGAMFAVSAAISDSGAAEKIANQLADAVGGAGPHALLIGLFVITLIFGQLISNAATALIVIPIAISAASELGVSARPVLISVTVAAAASFLTPIATPANLMVMGPGGYRFGDYWKLGLCMVALFFVVAVWLVPVFWRF
jgi:di/tricarboxylate transporter